MQILNSYLTVFFCSDGLECGYELLNVVFVVSARELENAVEVAVSEARVRKVTLTGRGPLLMENTLLFQVFSIKKVEALRLEECIGFAMALVEDAKELPGTLPTSGGFTRSKGRYLILNINEYNWICNISK